MGTSAWGKEGITGVRAHRVGPCFGERFMAVDVSLFKLLLVITMCCRWFSEVGVSKISCRHMGECGHLSLFVCDPSSSMAA